MSAAVLLLLGLAIGGPPYYARPVDPAADLRQLRAEAEAGTARPEEWASKIQIYIALGELQEIPDLVDLLATTFPEEPVFLEARMMFLGLARRFDEAILLGERLLREFPAYPTIRVNLGRIYFAAGKRPQGVNLLLAALARGPIRVEDWSLLLQGLGLRDAEPESMLATLRKKVEERPESPSLRYLLMVVLTRLGRYDEARALLVAYPDLADHPELRIFVDHSGPASPPVAKAP